jgi:DNA-directed RNA polymerase specialized sigma24 family protein
MAGKPGRRKFTELEEVAMILRRRSGWTIDEIARGLRCGKSSVQSHLEVMAERKRRYLAAKATLTS